MPIDLTQSLSQGTSRTSAESASSLPPRTIDVHTHSSEAPESERIGHFRFLRKIGEGGMGVVYLAEDEVLGRQVAIKMIRGSLPQEARGRFRQEARSLARINHPRICQIFEVYEDKGVLYLVLEFIAGESLAERLRAGPMTCEEALRIAGEILEALQVLHDADIIHRDLKPSNVFLTPHGAKLLDFGLAKQTQKDANESADADTAQTIPGSFIGTPHYMAPEQIEGVSAGPASDLFSAGCVIYEMFAGRRAFQGDSVVDVLYRVKHEQPEALEGSSAMKAADGVIRRALAKRPEERFQSPREMAEALLTAGAVECSGAQLRGHSAKRFLALPFRVLRRDDDTDFLAYSLPDAIVSSLSAIDSLIVRSSLLASRFDGSDLRKIAVEAGVDVVLAGTLIRIGQKLQVTSQLIEVPSGVLIWSDSGQFDMTDVFQLQNRLANRIVQSLVGQLTEREREVFHRDVPANGRAYECYLRANQIVGIRLNENAKAACDLYLECLKEDPSYAPAWARLGRVYRLLEKFGPAEERARYDSDAAFRRAFALNPDLTIAHNLYTSIEADRGHAPDAMVRLLERAKVNHNDPELFAGLVQSCRYCGELRASLVAHQRARKLDPLIMTSIPHTCFLLCDYQGVLDWTPPEKGLYLDAAALVALGQEGEALRRLRDRESHPGGPQAIMRSLRAILEGNRAGAIDEIDGFLRSGMRDPESVFYAARHMARLGETQRAIEMISETLEQNFICDFSLAQDGWLESLRRHDLYGQIMEKAGERRRESHAAFVRAGGEVVLRSDSLSVP